jgi:GT2 family glycosyltransferase
MSEVDIVIVNWNSGEFLKDSLESLIKFNKKKIGQIIVVDNNSSDRSADILNKNNIIKIIKERKNHGFGKACNIGASHSRAEYLLFLNPDTRIFENTIKDILEFMDRKENSKIAICGAQMLDSSHNIVKSCSYFPNVSRLFFKSIGLDYFFKSKGLLMRDFDHKDSIFVDQIIGAFFLIRKEVFLKLNGFDERFFLYFEEVDLSLRSFRYGYKSFYNSKIKCFHKGGVSTDNDKVSRQKNYLISRIMYAKKHFLSRDYVMTLIITLFFEFIARFFYSLYKFSLKEFKILFLSYFYFYKWLLK